MSQPHSTRGAAASRPWTNTVKQCTCLNTQLNRALPSVLTNSCLVASGVTFRWGRPWEEAEQQRRLEMMLMCRYNASPPSKAQSAKDWGEEQPPIHPSLRGTTEQIALTLV